ncbi:Bax inhibitor-1/YccA family protein [Acetobacteraceae bacterium]|nr:Bax inhibitor-1/YccA family protein [Acetobacteraceae bacterium]
MNFNQDFQYNNARAQENADALDLGLRAYMRSVYNWMGLGLFITAISAWSVVNTSLRQVFFHFSQHGLQLTGMGWLAALAPLVFVFVLSAGINRLSRPAAAGLFVLFSICMGISCSNLLIMYTASSVVRTFLITALMFLSISFLGYVTKRSLSGFGTFLFMALIGLILASVVNIFLPSHNFDVAISFAGVLIFSGLTAYDTQRIKVSYQQYLTWMPQEAVAKQGIYDALSLYLDFINLFQFLIRFLGTPSRND